MLCHQGLKHYLSNTSWLLAENMLRLLAGLFVGIYVARFLGPDQYGLYSYSLAFVSLFGAIANLGLDSLVVRELVNQPESQDKILGTAFWLKTVGAILMMITIGAVVPFTNNNATTKTYISIIAFGVIFQAFDVIDIYFQTKVQAKYVSICKAIQLLLISLVKLYLIYVCADLIWFVITTTIGVASLSIFMLYAMHHKYSLLFLIKFDTKIAKALMKESWPMIFAGLALMLQARIDQVMIKEMISSREVGFYSIAMGLTDVFAFVPTVLRQHRVAVKTLI